MTKIRIPHIDTFRPERNKLEALQFLYSAIGKLSNVADGQVLEDTFVDPSTIYDTDEHKFILNCEFGKYYKVDDFAGGKEIIFDINLPNFNKSDKEIGMSSIMFEIPSSDITVNINSTGSNINYLSGIKLGTAASKCELNIFYCYSSYYVNLINYDTAAQQLVLTNSK